MAGNRPNRNYVPGEKPVINEKLEAFFPDEFQGPEVKKTEENIPGSQSLKEGKHLFHMKNWGDALREFLLVETGGFSEEERAELAYYLGLCYTKLGRYDEALVYLEQVVGSGGDVLRVYQCRLTLAYIYVITGRAKLAEYELSRLQKKGFESAPLYNTLAYAAYTQKRYQDAVEFYEKALNLEENNATAMNSMGYILADTGMDAVRGLRFCKKAVEYRPASAVYLDSLGWAHYKCGELAEARKWLGRAIDLAPQEKEIREHFRIVTGGAA